jgi:hypothetical protein
MRGIGEEEGRVVSEERRREEKEKNFVVGCGRAHSSLPLPGARFAVRGSRSGGRRVSSWLTRQRATGITHASSPTNHQAYSPNYLLTTVLTHSLHTFLPCILPSSISRAHALSCLITHSTNFTVPKSKRRKWLSSPILMHPVDTNKEDLQIPHAKQAAAATHTPFQPNLPNLNRPLKNPDQKASPPSKTLGDSITIKTQRKEHAAASPSRLKPIVTLSFSLSLAVFPVVCANSCLLFGIRAV